MSEGKAKDALDRKSKELGHAIDDAGLPVLISCGVATLLFVGGVFVFFAALIKWVIA